MKISFVFENDEVDNVDPLGSATICEGNNCIRATCIFLGSFFFALVSGFLEAQLKGSATMDLEEPDLVRIDIQCNNITIDYANQSVTGNSIEFAQELRRSSSELLGAFSPEARQGELLSRVRQFVFG